MPLTWERTVIGGRITRYDYTARDGDVLVGRVTKIEHGPGAGEWSWSMVARFGWGRTDLTTYPAGAQQKAAAVKVKKHASQEGESPRMPQYTTSTELMAGS